MMNAFKTLTLAGIVLAGPLALLAQEDDAATTQVVEMTQALFQPYLETKHAGKLELPSPMDLEAIAEKNPQAYITGPLAEALKTFHASAEPMLGFDPLIDAQDWEIAEFKITPGAIEDNASGSPQILVRVTFNNFGEARDLTLTYWKEEGANGRSWKLAEVRANKGAEGRKFILSEEVKTAAD